MSSSPDPSARPVLRGAGASGADSVDFDTDLRVAVPAGAGGLVRAARDAARAAGYADGWAQGQRAARLAGQAASDQRAAAEAAEAQRRGAAARRALGAVATAAASLDARHAPALVDLSEVILAAAVEIAEAIVGHEIDHGEHRGMAAVRRATALVPDGGAVTVRLHPDQYDEMVATIGAESVMDGRPVRLRPDPALAAGDSVAVYGPTTVDATVAAAVARVRQELDR